MARPVGALPLIRLQPKTWKPLSFLFDIGFTRATWMHRIDISRALGRAVPATTDHDGRIIADFVADWGHHPHRPVHLAPDRTGRRHLQPQQ